MSPRLEGRTMSVAGLLDQEVPGRSRLVSEVMGREVVTLAPGQSLAEAARSLNDRRQSGALVLDGERLVGIITERDLVRAVVDGLDPVLTTVASSMTRPARSAAWLTLVRVMPAFCSRTVQCIICE